MSLGQLIRDKGFRQRYVAGQVGIHYVRFNQMCNGHAKIDIGTADAIARCIQADIAAVIAAALEPKGTEDGSQVRSKAGRPRKQRSDDGGSALAS